MNDLDAATYAHLRALAARALRGSAGTLQPTVVLHEAWEKLDRSGMAFEGREHFLAVAARAMRQIVLNHARDRAAQKRGGDRSRTTLSGVVSPHTPVDVVAIDQVLTALEAAHPDAARVVLLRVYGGMTVAEVATATGWSERTVARHWRFARAVLVRELSG